MVAISLYRGELHRVPSVPRRWPIPPRAITLRQFKLLRDKRSEAVARFFHDLNPPNPEATAEDLEIASESQISRGDDCILTPRVQKGNTPGFLWDEGTGSPSSTPQPGSERAGPDNADLTSNGDATCVKEEPAHEEEAHTGMVLKLEERPSLPHASQLGLPEKVNGTDSEVDAKLEEHNSTEDDGKKELEKKLDMLSEKKHHLVQMLKLVLNAEEEMKRRISIQPSSVHASASPGTVDTSSIAKHATSKLAIDVNCGDVGGETDFADPNAPVGQVSPRVTHAASGNAPTISSFSESMTTKSSGLIPGQEGHLSGLLSPSFPGAYIVASTPSAAASRAFSLANKDASFTSP